MEAAYVFRVRFRVDGEGVRLDPAGFETVLEVPAPEPGTESAAGYDWRFFRDNLWRGNANDERHLRETAAELLGVDATAVSFRELRTDRAYLDALREAVAADLSAFNADDVDEVLHKYLGSSIRVVD